MGPLLTAPIGRSQNCDGSHSDSSELNTAESRAEGWREPAHYWIRKSLKLSQLDNKNEFLTINSKHYKLCLNGCNWRLRPGWKLASKCMTATILYIKLLTLVWDCVIFLLGMCFLKSWQWSLNKLWASFRKATYKKSLKQLASYTVWINKCQRKDQKAKNECMRMIRCVLIFKARAC